MNRGARFQSEALGSNDLEWVLNDTHIHDKGTGPADLVEEVASYPELSVGSSECAFGRMLTHHHLADLVVVEFVAASSNQAGHSRVLPPQIGAVKMLNFES
jgi:hypothetical protein